MNGWEQFADTLGCIRLLLLVDWDPLGVFGVDGAMDEYDSYAPAVHGLLAADASQEELVGYLRHVGREFMGLPGRPADTLTSVAVKLREVYEATDGGP